MHHRSAIVATKNSELALRLKSIFSAMDVDVHFLPIPLMVALQESIAIDLDLLIVDNDKETLDSMPEIESTLFSEGSTKLFIIVPQDQLATVHFPARLQYDFVVDTAPDIELQVRLHQLLWPGEEAGSSDFIRIGNLTLNLATYQVKVDGVTLDLTYLEYALLAFLLTHPGRTYSRDALLRRVWGFEYYGGSRTVDVHIRRVRSKLGPELAQHLETVRGVGYYWNS